MSGFEELGLFPELVQAVDEMGWHLPRAVQAEAIPLILGGGPVLCAAATGEGKTGAFGLPLLQVTYENLLRRGGGNKNEKNMRCVLNPSDANSNAKISADGLLCQSHDPRGWSGVRATFGVSKGKWYYEATVAEMSGILRVGWSTAQAGLELGKDAFGFGYGGTGKKSFSNTFEDYGGTFGIGDVIGCAADLDAGTITFYKNGTSLGQAFTVPQSLMGQPLHPAICVKNSMVQMSFSPKAVKYLPKNGFRAIDEATGEEQVQIQKNMQRLLAEKHAGTTGPTSLVIEPTLELAAQVVSETNNFSKYLNNPKINVCSVVGKRENREIMMELRKGAQIVVGTPGKLESFLDSGELSLSNLRFLIFDEADRLAAEYINFVRKIYRKAQEANNGRTQVCMFSATLHSPEIRQIASELCPEANWVDLKGKDYVPETVHHAIYTVDFKEGEKWTQDPRYNHDQVHPPGEEKRGGDFYSSLGAKVTKPQILVKMIDAYQMSQCLIFCRTRLDCDLLSSFLTQVGGGRATSGTRKDTGKENKYSNAVLHSGIDARARAENLALFKDGYVRFLISTDVAARGIDIGGLPYVINMTLPDNAADYIHRCGRVGRADRMGLALSIVSRHKEKVWFHTCPNRGEGCTNRDLAKSLGGGKFGGGCCIWYDEPKVTLQIQQLLGQALDEVDHETFKSPALEKNSSGEVTYGRSAEEDKRAQGLSPMQQKAAQQLKELDQSVQLIYHANTKNWANRLNVQITAPVALESSGNNNNNNKSNGGNNAAADDGSSNNNRNRRGGGGGGGRNRKS